ncbi:MFS transporter [Bradyrhizobium sp. SSUT77]|uniref:MFS transporter n=1 Tax=unclassified Bradyrhizobium TaxID=2631580 RepID=UPI0032639990
MIKIEYQISPENVDAFLGLMRDRRRVQTRVGARQWTLLRDLQAPFRWTETFRSPTW